jgi:ring-1,2-phenylacetyl-CoA epoxidase subunit PaaD
LEEVPDPELPVLSVVDLGIVRNIEWIDEDRAAGGAGELKVTVTPTYSGCPATRVIERDIVRTLREHGVAPVRLEVHLAPAWTTAWIRAAARDKLRAYGVAPPNGDGDGLDVAAGLVDPVAPCPRCGSSDTDLISRFGSTPCKALYRCTACREPFDHFKCH